MCPARLRPTARCPLALGSASVAAKPLQPPYPRKPEQVLPEACGSLWQVQRRALCRCTASGSPAPPFPKPGACCAKRAACGTMPVAQTPVAPTPVAPTPVAPTPVAPTPVAQCVANCCSAAANVDLVQPPQLCSALMFCLPSSSVRPPLCDHLALYQRREAMQQ
eukprot:92609-Chlamydomonas_euryale.AAC.2